MAGIYNRDNIGSILMTGLENALRRRNERTKTENARTADSIKAINSFVKSAGYAGEDDLDDKLNQLKMERLAAQKVQEDANQAVLDANERSLVAEQNMQGYKPLMASYPDPMRYYEAVGTPTDMNQYDAALGMSGYYHPNVTLPRYIGNRSMRNPEQGRIPQIYIDAMLKHGEGVY